jgi:hypothetical protein
VVEARRSHRRKRRWTSLLVPAAVCAAVSPAHAQLQPIGDVSAAGTEAGAPELVAIAESSRMRAEDNRAELTMRPAQRARADGENTYWTNTGPDGGWVRPRSTLGERWRVDKVAWASWGDPVATGTANATLFSETRDASGGRGISPLIPVTVTLSDVADCLGTRIYTSMTVLSAEGAAVPAEFSASARVIEAYRPGCLKSLC